MRPEQAIDQNFHQQLAYEILRQSSRSISKHFRFSKKILLNFKFNSFKILYSSTIQACGLRTAYIRIDESSGGHSRVDEHAQYKSHNIMEGMIVLNMIRLSDLYPPLYTPLYKPYISSQFIYLIPTSVSNGHTLSIIY